jgi:hypothetical protein
MQLSYDRDIPGVRNYTPSIQKSNQVKKHNAKVLSGKTKIYWTGVKDEQTTNS